MQFTIDALRRSRMPAAAPAYDYVEYLNFPVTVGLAVIPLTAALIPSTFVIIQADQANAGTVEVGGSNLQAGAGLELAAGRAVSFDPGGPSDQALMASLGMGIQPYLVPAGRSWLDRMLSSRPKIKVVSLHSIRVVATVAAQVVRVMYTIPPVGM